MKNVKQNIVNVGEFSKDFSLLDYNKEKWQLHSKIGQILALLFYPGDETLVCTKQLCSVRDNWARYMDTGANVIGISPGTEDQHQKFAEHRWFTNDASSGYESSNYINLRKTFVDADLGNSGNCSY